MKITYSNIEEFEDTYNINYGLYNTLCSCGAYFEMHLENINVSIGEYEIQINECPVMVCEKCGKKHLCPDIPQEIYTTYFEMVKNGHSLCKLTMKANIRYEYAEKADFIYDSRDMCIPGIGVDLDPTHPKGFSCPVFFKRNVLNNFFTDDDYELDFFSESYGAIAKRGTDGWQYEWKIVFGINKNDKVILFLGDLDQIEPDDPAIYWLKSYNEKSDHCIVDTELFRGQMNCIFSEPIMEKRIISLRNAFFKKMKEKYDVELFHLEEEVEKKGDDLQKPINYSKREVKENIITLDGVLNEGIDCEELRKLCMKIVAPVPKNIKDLKTRKLLQTIIAEKSGEDAARKIVAPLFYLNDLRVCFAHLIPQKEIDEYEANIVSAFGLSDFTEYKKMYDTLIDELYSLYRYLNVTEI